MFELGLSKEDIRAQLRAEIPAVHYQRIDAKLQSLSHSTVPAYWSKIQQKDIGGAIDIFEAAMERGEIDEEKAIAFLRAVFMVHEELAKKRGLLYLSTDLNAWMKRKSLQYCIDVSSQKIADIIANPVREYSQQELELLETVSLVHYTYGNYETAAVGFVHLVRVCADPEKQREYMQHVATCYGLSGKYKEALEIDSSSVMAWERWKPTAKEGFWAQDQKMRRAAAQLGRECMNYWPACVVVFENIEVTLARLSEASFCGQDPMVFDEHYVYAGNRGNFRFANPNDNDNQTVETGIVVFATNSSNHYHLLIEFMTKLLAVHAHLPNDIPIYVSTEQCQSHRILMDLLKIENPVRPFRHDETIKSKELYVVDVHQRGHVLPSKPNLWDCYLANSLSVLRLREQVLSALSCTPCSQAKFIYVRRQGGIRSFVDPDQRLEAFLQSWTAKNHMELVVFDGNRSFSAQVELFSQARMIFGIHGAGFANVIFSPRDCVVVELGVLNNAIPLFQELSAMCGLHHHLCDLDIDYQGKIVIEDRTIASLRKDLETACAQLSLPV